MNKKVISMLICFLLLLSGCSSADPDSISYQIEQQTTVSVTNDDRNALFASDLTVVDEETVTDSDNAITSSASLIINRTTGELIYGEHIFDKIYPASITKIATALMALKYGDMTDVVSVSYEASHITEAGAKLCGFLENDQLTLETLFHSMLVYSGNDAAIAIADHLYGSEEDFSEQVNLELEALGATHTNFLNSSGLDNVEHYTTAYDLYLIFNELLNYGEFKETIKESSYKAEYVSGSKQVLKYFASTNQYLSGLTTPPEGVTVLGGKTGTTSRAGYCLILYSKDDNGNEYISLVLDASSKEDLYKQMNHLLSKIK